MEENAGEDRRAGHRLMKWAFFLRPGGLVLAIVVAIVQVIMER